MQRCNQVTLPAFRAATRNIFILFFFLIIAVCRMHRDQVMYCIYFWLSKLDNCNMTMVKKSKLCFSNVTIHTLRLHAVLQLTDLVAR